MTKGKTKKTLTNDNNEEEVCNMYYNYNTTGRASSDS